MTIPDKIPTARKALPLIGHILPMVRDPLRFLTTLPEQGGLVRIRIGPKSAIVVCDPQLTRRVLHDDRTFDKGGPIFDRGREVLGDGLVTCLHSRHRRQRRLVQPAFRPDRIRGYATAMAESIAAVIDSWRDGQTIDATAEMMKITSSVVTATLLSGSVPDSVQQVLHDASVVLEGIYQRSLMPQALTRIPTPGNRRFGQAVTRLRGTLSEIISERRALDADRGDLLSALIAARDDSSDTSDTRALSDTEIVDHAITFYLGAIESTATTLAWALLYVAENPAIERRLHSEVDTVLAGRTAAYADLPRLELTGRIVTETLRIRPPAWLLTRITSTDTQLGDYTLPAGTTVIYSPYLIHHDPSHFTEPERFDPDRWDERHSPTLGKEYLLPFGGGARTCIGDRFAMTEAKLALASIAARKRVEPLSDRPVRAALAVVERPVGLQMQIRTRMPSASEARESIH
jgi:cytochrome P450